MSSAKGASAGLAQHPTYFAQKVTPEMRLPGDTRLFRDIKVHEIPQWLMKRDFSVLGMWFSMKRFRCRFYSKYVYVRNMRGVPIAQMCFLLSVGGYISGHDYLKRNSELHRKYH